MSWTRVNLMFQTNGQPEVTKKYFLTNTIKNKNTKYTIKNIS